MVRDPARPLLLSVVFWLVVGWLVAAAVGYAVTSGAVSGGVPFGVNLALLVGLWPVLAWTPDAPTWRKAAGLCFLTAAFALGFTGAIEIHLPLTLVALANIGLVYGVRASAAIVTALLAASFAIMMLGGRPWDFAAAQTAYAAIGAAFVLGMVSATLEARRRRADTERLLARVRELTVAEERARMARDMHDSLGHRLTVIKMGLENAERRPDDVWTEVRRAKDQAATALAEARRWVRALRPLDLDDHVGPAALAALARSYDGTDITVTFTVSGAERPLPPDIELVLYRVLQEGLTNTVRHSGATTVRARLTYASDQVVLTVTDNGKGTDAPPAFGLTALAERTEALGGHLTAHTPGDTGHELRARLPASPP